MAYPIQIILTRLLAGHLSVPLFLVDPKGNLLSTTNRPRPFWAGDSMRRVPCPRRSGRRPSPRLTTGDTIPPANLPLMVTLAKQRPAYQRFFIRGLNGVLRHIEVAAIPIAGVHGDFLGAAALFWELSE